MKFAEAVFERGTLGVHLFQSEHGRCWKVWYGPLAVVGAIVGQNMWNLVFQANKSRRGYADEFAARCAGGRPRSGLGAV